MVVEGGHGATELAGLGFAGVLPNHGVHWLQLLAGPVSSSVSGETGSEPPAAPPSRARCLYSEFRLTKQAGFFNDDLLG